MPRTITVVDTTSEASSDVRLEASSQPVRALLPFFQQALTSSATTLSRGRVVIDERLAVTDLHDGDVLALGPVEAAPAAEDGAAMRPRLTLAPGPDGTSYVVQPAAASEPSARAPTIEFPELPTQPAPQRLPLLASLTPLLAGIGMAVVMHRWEFLAFAVMSPLVVAGQALSDRWHLRRTARRNRKDHETAVAGSEARLLQALHDERRRRLHESPDLATVKEAARHRTTLLWSRPAPSEGTAMYVRLGLGATPADVVAHGRPGQPVVDDVPICVQLGRGDVVGVCGADAAAVTRALVVQAVALHGPSAMPLTVLAPGGAHDWAWTRWLPHTRMPGGATAVAFDAHTVRSQLARHDERIGHRVVVVAGRLDPAGAADIATQSKVAVLWVADHEAELPAWCTSIVHTDDPHRGVRVESLTADEAECVARSLAPLRDVTPATTYDPPATVDWSELVELPLHDVDATSALLERRWSRGPTTVVSLGLGTDGRPVTLDLAAQGPHALVAGTTGSGKSELLQSLVAGLVINSSPADLSLLLLDYKGGATFGPCARLPHTVQVLTDLDAAATARVLQSLNAELRRRERIFATAGVADLDTLHRRQQAGAASAESVPRLVIVVDEFAALIEEHPDFVGGLVGIAARGRSLGVHLVLATQRPEGAVSADIRANTRLRLCLAVTRESESRDVIDSPAAAAIDPATPGRAWLRTDGHDLVELQTARINSAVGHVSAPHLLPLWEWGSVPDTRSAPSTDGTQLDALVTAVNRAAAASGSKPASRPWLPPLPEQLHLGEPTAAADVAFGLVDLPSESRQDELVIARCDTEPLLVAGAGRTGRTTAAVAVAVALAQALSPDELHIWAIDTGAGLGDLQRLPHTGAVVAASDSARVERLLTHLSQLVRARRVGNEAADRQLLLIVDSWDGLCALDPDAGVRCQDLVLRLLSDGPSVGLRVIVTSDRSGLVGRLANGVTDKIVLRLADRGDYALLGIAPREIPTVMPPGRGFRSIDHAPVQIAVPGATNWATASAWTSPTHPPRRFEPLPVRFPLRGIAVTGRTDVVIGVRADDLQPVSLNLAETGTFLVSGPSGSGRSTALLTLAAQLKGRRLVAICGRRSPLEQLGDFATVVSANVPRKCFEIPSMPSPAVLLVDDVDTIDDPIVLDHIEQAVRAAHRGEGFVALSGHGDTLAACFRGPIPLARRRRAGLLLRPEARHDGDLLGVRLSHGASPADPPGRGLLALNGTAMPVQVPDPN